MVGECGHAWRVAYSFWNTLSGVGAGADTTDKHALKLQCLHSRHSTFNTNLH
jgi:hypothetical protein